jgi:hypothetical protein
MGRVSERFLQLLDVMVFYILILLAMIIFFFWSYEIAIWLMGGMIAIYSLLYIPNFFNRVRIWRYRRILNFCHQYPLVREEKIAKGLQIDPNEIHAKLFILADFLKKGALIVFVKRYYLYVREDLVNFAVDGLKKKMAVGSMKSGELIKEMGEKFEFETRSEIEALISRIREVILKKNVSQENVE